MKRIILSIMASIAMIIGLAAGFAPVASAAPTVPVGPGTGWTLKTVPHNGANDSCTITAVGHDNAGRLIGLTAGHCLRDPANPTQQLPAGQPIYKTVSPVANTQIGVSTGVQAWGGQGTVPQSTLDYAVIELDPNVVIPRSLSEDGTLSVTSFGTAGLFQNICKDGIATGNTCGLINNVSTNYYKSWASMFNGDSGSPAVKAGTGVLVAVGVGYDVSNPSVFIYNKIQPVLTDINAKASYGAGFTLVP